MEPLAPGDSLTETRDLWVSRFEYASEQDVRTAIQRAADVGFNVVYLQVHGRADAFYRSSLEPWAANFTGTLGADPGWDPLGVAVAEGRNRAISVHAWINAFTGWAGTTPPPVSDPPHAFLEHPDWAMVGSDGVVMPYTNDTRWLTPGHPEVRTRLARVAADIVRNYGVGGIHLDFIRYPGTDDSYDTPSLAAWDSARVTEPTLDFDETRRRFVTRAVEETRDSIRAVSEGARLSWRYGGSMRTPGDGAASPRDTRRSSRMPAPGTSRGSSTCSPPWCTGPSSPRTANASTSPTSPTSTRRR
ncbi:MAG: family 10 glycosylhydrolase [Gemmatimonadota bacterium]|nr:family 10 glycosylhydrolase [Gemmatimonadota bacterium]